MFLFTSYTLNTTLEHSYFTSIYQVSKIFTSRIYYIVSNNKIRSADDARFLRFFAARRIFTGGNYSRGGYYFFLYSKHNLLFKHKLHNMNAGQVANYQKFTKSNGGGSCNYPFSKKLRQRNHLYFMRKVCENQSEQKILGRSTCGAHLCMMTPKPQKNGIKFRANGPTCFQRYHGMSSFTEC